MPQRQQDRSKATRAALIATARRLFAEHGYAAVPAGEIVAEAGLTRGALYHHFQDKQGLFEAVFVELEEELGAEIRASMTTGPAGAGRRCAGDASSPRANDPRSSRSD